MLDHKSVRSKFLYMERQLCCRGMCKILERPIRYNLVYNKVKLISKPIYDVKIVGETAHQGTAQHITCLDHVPAMPGPVCLPMRAFRWDMAYLFAINIEFKQIMVSRIWCRIIISSYNYVTSKTPLIHLVYWIKHQHQNIFVVSQWCGIIDCIYM